MPYLRTADRIRLERGGLPETPGHLNYVLTCAVLAFLGATPNYERFNAAVGALECAKQELYRKAIAPYEDQKSDENGTLPWPRRR